MKGGTKGKTTAVYVENPLTMYNPLFSVQQIVTEKMNAIFLLVNDRNTNWTLYTVRRSTKHITILTGSLQSYSINYGLEAPYFGYAFFKPIFKKLAHYLSLKLSHNTWRPWKKKKNFRACLTRSKRSVCFSSDPNISFKRDPSLWIPFLKLLILRMQRKMTSGRSFLVEEKLPFRFVGRHPRCFRVSLKEQSSTSLSIFSPPYSDASIIY